MSFSRKISMWLMVACGAYLVWVLLTLLEIVPLKPQPLLLALVVLIGLLILNRSVRSAGDPQMPIRVLQVDHEYAVFDVRSGKFWTDFPYHAWVTDYDDVCWYRQSDEAHKVAQWLRNAEEGHDEPYPD